MAEFLAHLRDPVLFAVPVFLLFVTIEIVAVHVLGHDDNVVGYSVADTRTSMLMGTVAVGVNAVFRLVMLVVFAALFELAPVKLDPRHWWTWALMLLGQELVRNPLDLGASRGRRTDAVEHGRHAHLVIRAGRVVGAVHPGGWGIQAIAVGDDRSGGGGS